MKNKFSWIILLSLIYSNNISAQGVWTQKANFPGLPRGDAFSFSIGNMGYMGAGADAGINALNDVWQYDAINNTWTQKANFGGTARWQGAAFSIGSKGYFGMGSGIGLNNDFWEYDPSLDTWTQKASIPAEKRTAPIGFAIGNKGYLGTGYGCSPIPCAETNHKDFWEYDPLINSWAQKANIPTNGRAFGFGLSIGSKGYVGTGHDDFGNTFNDLWEYNPVTDTWIRKANFPGGPRHDIDGAHFTIGNYGYVGTGYYPAVINTFNDFWKYDPLTDSWSNIPNLPAQSRIGAIGFSINNRGYIGIGFWFTNVANALNDLWEYGPLAKPVCNFQSSDTSFCNEGGNPCISFTDQSTNNPTTWHWLFPGATPDSSYQQNPTNICYTQPGTYSVSLIVTNSVGFSTLTASPMITVGAVPPSPILMVSNDTIYCSHAASYQWYHNGNIISGATDSFYVFAQNGIYAVQITDSIGCSRLSDGVVITEVKELADMTGIKIYPNPLTTSSTLQLNTQLKNAEVIIYDMLGKEMVRKKITGNRMEIERGSLESGVYFVRVRSEERQWVEKVVVN